MSVSVDAANRIDIRMPHHRLLPSSTILMATVTGYGCRAHAACISASPRGRSYPCEGAEATTQAISAKARGKGKSQPAAGASNNAAPPFAALLLAAGISLTAAPTAFADDWDAGTGDWFTDSNWLDGAAPTAADDATIDNGGTAQVQAPGAEANDVFVGVTDGNSGFLEITGGGEVSSNFGIIGLESGSSGEVTVDGTDSIWTYTGALLVGRAGVGTLAITSGGAVSNLSDAIVIIGGETGGTGAATVEGTGSTWTTNGELLVGDLGDGTLAISGGGAVSSALGTIAHWSGTSAVTVDGAGSTWAITGTHPQDPYNGDLTVGFRGGDIGALTITNGGTVSNTDDGVIGGPDQVDFYPEFLTDSYGEVTVDGEGSTWTSGDALVVGSYGSGSLTIRNGGAVSNDAGIIGKHASSPFEPFYSSTGEVTVDDAGSTWTNHATLTVGGFGTGTLNILNGGAVSTTDGFIGSSGSGGVRTGEVAVDGAGSSLTISGLLEIRMNSLTITNGGAVHSADATIGRAGANSTATVAGEGSIWTISGTLNMGLGPATINIGDGGAAGILNTASIDSGFGAVGEDTVNFNHTDADYYFTSDGTSGGTPVTIAGQAVVNHLGTGSTTLTGANTYTGTTTIDAGVLRIDGSVTSVTNVNSGGTLGGNGTVAAVTVADGGAIAPGTSAGTLTTGDLALDASSLLDFELDTPGIVGGGVNDLIVVDGDLVLDGVLDVADLGGFGAGTYTLLTYTGTLTGDGLTLGSVPPWGAAVEIDTATPGEVRLPVEPAPVLALSTSGLDFGNVPIDTQSAAQTVTAENTGSADLDIGALGVSGANAADFTLAGDTCSNQTIAPAATCSFDVSLAPSALGARSAQVEVSSNAPSTPDTVILTGTGMSLAELLFMPTDLDFGDQPLGQPADAQMVVIENIGASDAQLGSLAVEGQAADDYTILTDTCSDQTLPVDAFCGVDIGFTASAPGLREARLRVPSDAPDNPHLVDLTGRVDAVFADGFED